MQIKIKEVLKSNEWIYPCLMIGKSSKEVVLAISSSSQDSFMGYNFNRKVYDSAWNKISFEKFYGIVELSND